MKQNLKKSIVSWCVPGRTNGGSNLRLRERMELARKAGFDAIELTVTEDDELRIDSTEEDIRKVRKMADDVGIEISSLMTLLFWDYSLTSSNDKTRKKARSIVKKMLQFASYLEVDTVLVVPGSVDVFFQPDSEVVPYEVAYRRSLSALKECAKIAEEYEVAIGIENVWNKFLLSPLEMRAFIDEIGSGYLGCYFDVGNVLLTGYPEDWISILGERIKKVHIKNFKTEIGNVNGFCGLSEGDVNWAEVMRALKEIGYNDYLVAETVPPKENSEAFLYSTSMSMDFILGRR